MDIKLQQNKNQVKFYIIRESYVANFSYLLLTNWIFTDSQIEI